MEGSHCAKNQLDLFSRFLTVPAFDENGVVQVVRVTRNSPIDCIRVPISIPYLALFLTFGEIMVKIADCNLPPPLLGVSPRSLAPENQSPWAVIWRCLRDPKFSHFGTILACDGHTDGQTHENSIYATSTVSHGKICYCKNHCIVSELIAIMLLVFNY